jgi:uncharacterized membrane protein YccC
MKTMRVASALIGIIVILLVTVFGKIMIDMGAAADALPFYIVVGIALGILAYLASLQEFKNVSRTRQSRRVIREFLDSRKSV